MTEREEPLLLHIWKPLYLLPGGSVAENPPAKAEDSCSVPGSEDLLEKEMATAPVSLPGESHGQRSLVGYCLWGRTESDMTEVT